MKYSVLLERITLDPNMMAGKRVIQRTPVHDGLHSESHGHGATEEKIPDKYHRLEREGGRTQALVLDWSHEE